MPITPERVRPRPVQKVKVVNIGWYPWRSLVPLVPTTRPVGWLQPVANEIGYPEKVRREAGEVRRRGRSQAMAWRGLRIVLLLMALVAMLYWFWWQPMQEPPPPLRIEFRP